MIELAGHRVEGTAVSGIGSAISLPSLKLGLDIGVCPLFAVNNRTILITHGHIDHMGSAVQHAAIRDMRGSEPSRFIVSVHLVPYLEEMFDLWHRAQNHSLGHEIIGLEVGADFPVGKGLFVRPFPTDHTLPSQGYGIWSIRQKLKDEFKGIPGREIARLRGEEGVEVTDRVEVCEVAYTGDTRANVIEEQEVVRTARLLIMEATFVDDEITTEFARARGHVHLRELAERADLFENEAVLMCHFSARHSNGEIALAIANLPPRLRDRTTPLIEEDP